MASNPSEAPLAARRERTERPRLVVLSGPTGAGKSALAMAVAQRFGGQVLNADSMQVYRFMDIGTAKPSLEERSQVPHHLFDLVTPELAYNAGRYAREARQCADRVIEAGGLPILCGGTGLYLRAFLHGLAEKVEVDPAIRERLESEHAEASAEGDPERLHRRLLALDPEAGATIHPNDLRRTQRALEMLEQSGLPASLLRARHAFTDAPYEALQLVLDPGPEILGPRIDRRCLEMLEAGLLREVRDLRQRGYGAELKSMQAIGYRHINPVVDGADTLANAQLAMQGETRQFARRQRTWWRAVSEAEWHDPRDPDGILRRIEVFLKEGLSLGEEPSRPATGS